MRALLLVFVVVLIGGNSEAVNPDEEEDAERELEMEMEMETGMEAQLEAALQAEDGDMVGQRETVFDEFVPDDEDDIEETAFMGGRFAPDNGGEEEDEAELQRALLERIRAKRKKASDAAPPPEPSKRPRARVEIDNGSGGDVSKKQ